MLHILHSTRLRVKWVLQVACVDTPQGSDQRPPPAAMKIEVVGFKFRRSKTISLYKLCSRYTLLIRYSLYAPTTWVRFAPYSLLLNHHVYV